MKASQDPRPETDRRPSKREFFSSIESHTDFQKDPTAVLKPCAICGQKRGRRLYMQANFPVIKCAGCSLVYADEHFEDDKLAEFYSGDYYERAYVCHPPEIDRKIANDYVRAFGLVDRLHEGGRLLDFGSARGTFIGELTARGHGERWQVEGLDINPDEVAMGRAEGLEITCGTLASAAFEPETFDVVTTFSVLEHLKEPIVELRRLREVLRPGGHLLAIVPAGDCLIVRVATLLAGLLGNRVRGFTDSVFHEEHLYYFTRSTMGRALELAGFQVIRFFGQPSYLETHPPGLLLGIGSNGLRFTSWALRMQTMLGVVAIRK